MRLSKISGIVFLSIILIGQIWGCKCNRNKEFVFKESKLSLIKDTIPFPGMVFLLPSPSEVLSITLNQDIAYNQNLLTPTDIEKKVIISHYQALITGVYFTDLSYCVIYKNYPEGIKNIEAIKKLSQNLGFGSILSDQYFKRIENSITSIDSLETIFDELTNNSFNAIESTGNYELLSAVAMGSGIEALYLSYNSINIKTIDKELVSELMGQKVIFENYYKNFMNFNYNKPELKPFVDDIKKIYSLIEREVNVKNNTTVRELNGNKIAIKDRIISSISEKGIREIGDSIIITRDKLVTLKYQ